VENWRLAAVADGPGGVAMTDVVHGSPPAVRAIGAATLPRRARLVRLGVLAGLVVLALGVRSAGLLSPDPSGYQLPPLPAAAQVAPGLLRGGQPAELDLVLLRDDFGVRGVVDVDGASAEEQAVTAGLGMRLLEVAVGEQGPSPRQLLELARFARSAATAPPSGGRAGAVYLHDTTGTGPVLVVSAAMLLLDHVPLPEVLGRLRADGADELTPATRHVLQQIADVAAGRAAPDNPYSVLGEVIP
jgi:hypothetical protein